jgi:stage III sporulation protein AE
MKGWKKGFFWLAMWGWLMAGGQAAWAAPGAEAVWESRAAGQEAGTAWTGLDVGQAAGRMGISEDLGHLEEFLQEITGGGEYGREGFSFQELMGAAATGNLLEILAQAGKGLTGALSGELDRGGTLLAQVVLIGFVGAVFSNVSSVFKGGQISDAGFFVTYLLLFTCLAGGFLSSLNLAQQVLNSIFEFMRLLMPAYYIVVAFSGGSISALALYEAMMAGMTLLQWLCGSFLLPAVKIYVLLVLGDHAMKELVLTRLSELTEQTVVWSLKTLAGAVIGFQLLQSMVLPYADALGSSTAKRLVGSIPGFGQGAGAVAQMVLGSGVLMKNSMGAAGVVALAVISMIPVLKLVILMVLYQWVAAMMQPVCDKRMVSCVAGVSRGHKLLLQVVLYSMFLFMLSIAITCGFTNVGYFAA